MFQFIERRFQTILELRSIWWILAMVILGGGTFGMVNVATNALPAVALAFHLNDLAKTAFVSIQVLGNILGAYLAGRLVDSIGRRKTLLLSTGAGVLFAGAGSFINMFWMVLVQRFLSGLIPGALATVVIMLAIENAPARWHGLIGLLWQIGIEVGIALINNIDELLFKKGVGWNAMLASPGAIELVLLAFSLFIVREGEATAQDFEPIKLRSFTRALVFTLIVAVFVILAQQGVGPNSVLGFGYYVLQQAGDPDPAGGMVVVSWVNLLGTLAVLPFIGRLGRRPLLLVGLSGCCVGLIITIVSLLSPGGFHLTRVGLDVFMFCFAFGPAIMGWLVPQELFAVRYRGAAMTVLQPINFTVVLSLLITFPSLADTAGYPIVFAINLIVGLFCLIFLWPKLPETKDRQLAS